jgi:hypothetical protein
MYINSIKFVKLESRLKPTDIFEPDFIVEQHRKVFELPNIF